MLKQGLRAGVWLYTVLACVVLMSCFSDTSRYASKGFKSDGLIEDHLYDTSVPACSEKVPCCSDTYECKKMCERMFQISHDRIQEQCQAMPKKVVEELEYFFRVLLLQPRVDELYRQEIKEQLMLIMTLDYNVLVDVIKGYTVDEAHQMLHWFAREKFVAELLLKLRPEVRNEIMYELFSSAGNRIIPNSVERGLAQKVSFTQSFFEVLLSYNNDRILKITHDMIRDKFCYLHESGDTDQELCVLKIYCSKNQDEVSGDSLYIHSETTRNEIVVRLEDEDFYKYIYEHVLQTGFGVELLKPVIDDTVCYNVCKDNQKGCNLRQ